MKLKDKIAIVTGGSQGIGEAICYAYGKEGAIVIVVNKNNPEAGTNVANKINHEGGRAEAVICDVTDEYAVNKLFEHILNKYHRIDILVNNAGVVVFKNFEDETLEDFNLLINVNLKGPFLMSKAAVPFMKTQNYGKIIFVSSVVASVGFTGTALYSATKAGLLGMANTMVAELASYNINVNSISPGCVATAINQQFHTDPEVVKIIAAKTPSGVAYMQPEHIAGSAVFLASDDSSSVHGLDLKVDNGWCAI